MDLKQTSAPNNPRATIVAAFLFGACLLTCGCQPAPSGGEGSDSQSNQPAKADSAADGSANKEAVDDGVETRGVSKGLSEKTKAKPVEPDVNDAVFHPAIKAAAEEYLQFAMVNTTGMDSPTARVAPMDCRADVFLDEPAAKMSQTDSDSGHGQKLYFLFAKDIAHYVNPDGSASPIGQALVKESWTAVPGNPDARNLRSHASGNRVNPRVTVGDETLKLGKRKELFVMLKQDPKTKGTDEGWVYGVIDPKSYEIKSAGAVASCIACHEGEQDRLFRDGIINWEAEALKQAKAKSKTATKEKSPADPESDE